MTTFVVPSWARPDPKPQPAACRSCGASIAWVVTNAGRRAPIDPDGTNHFVTCPSAAQWRKTK